MSFVVAAAAVLSAGLAFIGRHGARGLALSIFVGLALPSLSALVKPLFTPALFTLLVLSFLRVEPAALRRHAARPALALVAAAWSMFAVPLICGAALVAAGLAAEAPALYAALVLQAMAPPSVSSPALVALMGLDAALGLAMLIPCLIVAPFAAMAFATLFLGDTMALAPLALGAKTLAMLAGAALVAAVVRRLAGAAWVTRQAARIDGLNVLVLLVFAVAFMDGVAAHIGRAPLQALGLVALAFAVSAVVGVVTALVFARAGRPAALGLAVVAAMRNVGLMAAAAGGAVPELAWLYFAYVQFPSYLMPQLLKPLAHAVLRRHEKGQTKGDGLRRPL